MVVCLDAHLLAALLTDVATASGDVDGVLFGSHGERQTTRLTDDSDVPVTDTQRFVHLKRYACATSLCAFYDAAGGLDDARLDALVADSSATLVGWFVSRRETPLSPSQREAAVWLALQRRAQRLHAPPPLFAVLSAQQPRGGEPSSTQYAFFAPPDDAHVAPQPLGVVVNNHGSAPQPRDAPSPLASALWHPVLEGVGGGGAWGALEASAAHGASKMRATFEAALERAEQLCLEVERADDELFMQRERFLARIRRGRETSGDHTSLLSDAGVDVLSQLSSCDGVASDTEPLEGGATGYVPPPVTPDPGLGSIFDVLLEKTSS